MKCSTAQQPPHAVSNENCNNLNGNLMASRLANSISGIVDGTGILTQINPSPIIQHQTGNQMMSMGAQSSPPDTHKSAANAASTGSSSLTVSCGLCMQPICDRYIMKVVDTPYHERCLQCASCCCNLMNTCYQRDNKLYCRIDYER